MQQNAFSLAILELRKPTKEAFELLPHWGGRYWASSDALHRSYALAQLQETERLCEQLIASWPGDLNQPVRDEDAFPELFELARLRSIASDSTRLYAAMALEGFVNLYGVVRLGQRVFDTHFERLHAIPKLQRLLLIGESIEVRNDHPIAVALGNVARSRNELVHPKAVELSDPTIEVEGDNVEVPGYARQSVTNMETFFDEFERLVPAMKPHIRR